VGGERRGGDGSGDCVSHETSLNAAVKYRSSYFIFCVICVLADVLGVKNPYFIDL